MQSNGFWEFLVSVESEYSKYRKRIMNRFSLSSAEVDVLMFLANNPALDTAADISRIRHIPKSQVSLSVRSLCDDGFIVGTYANGNRKSVHLAVTKKAERIVDYGKDVQKEFYETLFSGFTENDRSEFLGLREKIAENIKGKNGEIK